MNARFPPFIPTFQIDTSTIMRRNAGRRDDSCPGSADAQQPNRAAAAATVGGEAALGRTIEAAVRDSVTYRFHVQEGAEVYAILEGRTGTDWAQVEAILRNPTNTARLGSVRVGGRGGMNATPVVRPAESAEHIVTVYAHGTNERAPSASFRLSLRTINRLPESQAARIVPGVVVSGESIDDFHDIDEFVFSARAGQELTVALQGLSGKDVPACTIGGNCAILECTRSRRFE
jgi:hypothetical protein